jgi:hypothetical protein
MARIYFWCGLGAAGVFATIAVACTEAQGSPSIWYRWILESAWVTRVLLSFSIGCFFMALRECNYFRRYCWTIFTWMIPKEVVGRSEPSPWHLLRELERETTKESELEKLRKQVAELKATIQLLMHQP